MQEKAHTIRGYFRYLAWAQAVIATMGSLYLSEVMRFIPCDLCWYQRILMYPLTILIAVGILLRDRRLSFYALPLCFLGLAVSIYHNLLYYEVIPAGWHVCTSGIPCETRWIQWFGFAGIPFMAFTAFVVVTLSLLWDRQTEESFEDDGLSVSTKAWVLPLTSALIIIPYVGLILIAITNR